jgi:hypothetical protein
VTYLLLQALALQLAEIFDGTVFRDPSVEDETDAAAFIAPRIFVGSLPAKRRFDQQKEDYPFIVARGPDGEDQDGESGVSAEIICGIYTAGDEVAGTNDIHNIIDRVRLALLKNRIVDNRFELQTPVTWTTGADEERNQPHPFYVGRVSATWKYIRFDHQESAAEEVIIYGAGYQ